MCLRFRKCEKNNSELCFFEKVKAVHSCVTFSESIVRILILFHVFISTCISSCSSLFILEAFVVVYVRHMLFTQGHIDNRKSKRELYFSYFQVKVEHMLYYLNADLYCLKLFIEYNMLTTTECHLSNNLLIYNYFSISVFFITVYFKSFFFPFFK